jgi:hypothetical protein
LIFTAIFNAVIVARDVKPEFWGTQEVHFAGTLEIPKILYDLGYTSTYSYDDSYMVDFPPDTIEVHDFMWTGAYTLIGFELRCGKTVVFSEGWGAGENGGYISYRVYQAYQWGGGPIDRLCIAYYDYYHSYPLPYPYPQPPVVDFSGYATLYGPDTGGESVNLNP